MPKKTFENAETAQAVLITQVKNNQKDLREQIIHGCAIQKRIDVFEEPLEKAHGRLEKRIYEVFLAQPMLNKWENDWPYLRHIIRVTRQRDLLNRTEKERQTVSYYVTNGKLSAAEYGKYIRQHWSIENKLHHVKDVAFQEDRQTKRCNPGIYSTCMNWSLNIMKIEKCENIKKRLMKNSMDFNQLKNMIKNVL